MKVRLMLLTAVLSSGVVCFSGCAVFLVGAGAGAGVAAYSWATNELKATKEASLDRAWQAAERAVQDMQFTVASKRKDITEGILEARNAKDQPVKIRVLRQSDNLSEIRISVGTFATSANRTTAQLIWDKMAAHLK